MNCSFIRKIHLSQETHRVCNIFLTITAIVAHKKKESSKGALREKENLQWEKCIPVTDHKMSQNHCYIMCSSVWFSGVNVEYITALQTPAGKSCPRTWTEGTVSCDVMRCQVMAQLWFISLGTTLHNFLKFLVIPLRTASQQSFLSRFKDMSRSSFHFMT